MEKLTSPDKKSSGSTLQLGSAVPIVTASAGPVLVILLTGYLTMQLQAAYANAFLGFNVRLVGVPGEWLPYVWRLGFVLLAVAAILVYRLAIRGTTARLVALTILAVFSIIASPIGSGLPLDEERYPLMLYMGVEGAKSPFTLALIGAIVAELIFEARRARD
jgi:thiol:disulfide interchange protein